MTVHDLPIEYNKNTPIGVVSTDAYNFLLYDKLFTDFKIVTEIKQRWLHDLQLGAKIADDCTCVRK
jgi:hypothetical protein